MKKFRLQKKIGKLERAAILMEAVDTKTLKRLKRKLIELDKKPPGASTGSDPQGKNAH